MADPSPELIEAMHDANGPWWVVGEGQAVIGGQVGMVTSQAHDSYGSTDFGSLGGCCYQFHPLVPPGPSTIGEALAEYLDDRDDIDAVCRLLNLDFDSPVPTALAALEETTDD